MYFYRNLNQIQDGKNMSKQKSFSQYVSPWMGVNPPGHCLPGPYMPFGMVKLGPDRSFPHPTSGYQKKAPIVRFSHTHVAGTGGPGRYGNIAVSPFTGEPRRVTMPPYFTPPLQRYIDAVPDDEKAEVGYYAMTMRPWGVGVELTCTQHTGVHRYRYPKGKPAWLVVDAASVIQTGRAPSGHFQECEMWDTQPVSIGGYLEITSQNELVGRSDLRGGWGHDKCYSIYFSVRSDKPFVESTLASDGGLLPSGADVQVCGPGCRALLRFKSGTELNLHVGISFVSVANARASIDREIAGRSFEDIRNEGVNEWERWLSPFSLKGGSEEQRRVFYSLLYRLHCMPTDLGVDDENPLWKSGVRQFTDCCCLWDSIRNANSFFHLFYPELSVDMMNSFLDIADHTGWLPDAHIAMHSAYMQSACAADILFSEAALKGLEGVDYEKALRYVRKNNEVLPKDVFVEGRYIDDYNKLGYLSTNVPKGCVSRHLEYTYHDWCIAQLAVILGDKQTAEKYLGNSKRIWNLWSSAKKSFMPRNPDGSWLKGFEPWRNVPEGWNDASCYEGSTIVWSMNVFQDFHGLIRRFGGPVKFIKVLDRIFDEGLFHIKETRMHIPHLYTYAGRPDLAAERVLKNLETFNTSPDGLTDNEDMGCQSGYFLWQSMGLYPIYGQAIYMLSPPLFGSVETKLGNTGKTLKISATRKGRGKYIVGANLGGKAINRAWVTHSELLEAGEIHFKLADKPNDWGRKELPPNAMLPVSQC